MFNRKTDKYSGSFGEVLTKSCSWFGSLDHNVQLYNIQKNEPIPTQYDLK